MVTAIPESGLFDLPAQDDDTESLELLEALGQYDRGESFLAWSRYICAERVFRAVSDDDPEMDRRLLDDFALTAARLAAARRITKFASTTMLNESIAAVYRLPLTAECLRDGVISPRDFQLLVSYTHLIDGMPYADDVDEDLANELRYKKTWTPKRLKDTADRIIGRYDLDAVRRRRQAAKDDRACWSRPRADGMAEIGATASAEEVALAMAAINALADSVCERDPRTVLQRRSDALICRAQGVPFECRCGRENCDAAPDANGVSEQSIKIVLHVIAERSTLDDLPDDELAYPPPADDDDPQHGSPYDRGELMDKRGSQDSTLERSGTAGSNSRSESGGASSAASHNDLGPDAGLRAAAPTHLLRRVLDQKDIAPAQSAGTPIQPDPRAEGRQRPGFLDGYGVISADQVREIANRPDTIIRELNPNPHRPLPAFLPSEPYRPSAALDTYIRARDGYCAFPGCTAPAWKSQLDHITEYDHQNPVGGGKTCPGNIALKCQFHHLIKTFGNWLDDMYTDPQGYTHTVIHTPEGLTVRSHAQTNEDLFPGLLAVRFQDPGNPPSPATQPSRGSSGEQFDPSKAEPRRRRTRLADKLSRRRTERRKNRDARWASTSGVPDEPGF